MKIREPNQYLLDEIIDFAEENNLSLEQAATKLALYAQQRIPEYRIRRHVSKIQRKTRQEILESPTISLTARVLIRSRIHSISWTCYPHYHVIETPIETHWYSIKYPMPVWESFSDSTDFYIDDLFYDTGHEKFWMDEPYLSKLPSSKALLNHLSSDELLDLEGTHFKKINPEILTDFINDRKDISVYFIKQGEWDKLVRRKPYGSMGWEKRISMVNKYSRLKR